MKDLAGLSKSQVEELINKGVLTSWEDDRICPCAYSEKPSRYMICFDTSDEQNRAFNLVFGDSLGVETTTENVTHKKSVGVHLSERNMLIMPAEFVHKQKVGLKPVAHHYEKTGEIPYIKYGCPICEAIARDCEPDDEDEGTFRKFSFPKGTSNCPCCGVNFAWKEEDEL